MFRPLFDFKPKSPQNKIIRLSSLNAICGDYDPLSSNNEKVAIEAKNKSKGEEKRDVERQNVVIGLLSFFIY
ncbi:hypothetical protein Bca4012_058317 [Brassica carinata]